MDLGLDSAKAVQNLKHFQPLAEAPALLAYYPMPDELDLGDLLKGWLVTGKPLYLPRWGKDWVEFHEVKELAGLPKKWAAGHEILIPKESGARFDGGEAFLLVPCLMVDESGYRLGRGAGHYDRFLANNPNLDTLAVTPAEMITLSLPRESHDLPMKWIDPVGGPRAAYNS